jgi:hypothetical protein
MFIGDDFLNAASASRPPRTAYGSGPDALAVDKELGDFVVENSPASDLIHRYFGSNIRLTELKAIVMAAVALVKHKKAITLPKISRNAKRSKLLLIKYVDTHYAELAPLFPVLTLCDKNQRPIPILDATARDTEHGTVEI